MIGEKISILKSKEKIQYKERELYLIDDTVIYLALGRIPGITLRKLILLKEAGFESPKMIIEASEKELYRLLKNKELTEKIKRLCTPENREILKIKSMMELCRRKKIKVVTFFDKEYPLRLREIANPPLYLFIKGSILPQDTSAFSIIGTRNPSYFGHKKAREIARDLAQEGYTIISGLARGIDTEAHLGALDAGGRMIAVIGSGLLNIYPPENAELAEDISKFGAIITQSFPNERVKKWTLQSRNKLNCGLSLGSIFIEGTESSGTKWQLKFAIQQNKPLFGLIPENPKRKTAYIPLYIINKLKGHPISSAKEILEIYKASNLKT